MLRRPEVLMPLTFLAAIAAGTVLLMLPGMATEKVGPLEAFFTATSAVCVTGLAVVDTGSEFTTAGQAVIMGLIQLGGLGMMTFSVLALAIAGRRVSLNQEAAIRGTFTAVTSWRVGKLLVAIVGLTLLCEALGFVALYWATGDAWWSAFHSVSAFCNAGFSLNSTSLQGEPASVVIPITVLLVVGGLGFFVILEVAGRLRLRRHKRRPLGLHTRVVLRTTLLLLGLGTIAITVSERGDIANAFFMSASARTAGFDTISVGRMTGASLFLLIPLMFIGASPGSTGGGVKTTSFALAVLVARATLQGRDRIVVFGREVPVMAVRRMFAVFACSFVTVFLAIFLLHLFEDGSAQHLLDFAFEAVSAYGTVGLSTGITPTLSVASKILICCVMFIGRVGSLSLFVFLVRDAAHSRLRYPEERIMIG